MESRKIALMNQFAGKEWRHRHREWTCGLSKERKDGKNRESSIDIYTLSYVKQLANGKLLYNSGSPPWHSVMT